MYEHRQRTSFILILQSLDFRENMSYLSHHVMFIKYIIGNKDFEMALIRCKIREIRLYFSIIIRRQDTCYIRAQTRNTVFSETIMQQSLNIRENLYFVICIFVCKYNKPSRLLDVEMGLVRKICQIILYLNIIIQL